MDSYTQAWHTWIDATHPVGSRENKRLKARLAAVQTAKELRDRHELGDALLLGAIGLSPRRSAEL